MVCGAIGLAVGWLPVAMWFTGMLPVVFAGWLLSTLAIVLGCVGINYVNRGLAASKATAVTGLVLGAIPYAILIGVAGLGMLDLAPGL